MCLMRLLFFQNCISPHQMPYIEVLAKRDDVEHVWVVAPRLAYSERAAMGWPKTWTTSSEKLSILINPRDEEVESLFHSTPLPCGGAGGGSFFSGISAFPEVHHWFLLSLNYDMKRGIITEAPYTYDKPLWMHKIRFALKDWRYVKHFDYVFAIGEDCAAYYRIWSKRWKVVPFLYCTSEKVMADLSDCTDCMPQAPLRVCFVGSLDKRKNVGELMDALSQINNRYIDVTIVGDGPERNNIEQKVSELDAKISVRFMGTLPMEATQNVIARNDVLVLPSLHDGWGAVINEAMMLGTTPICSSKCGAKYVIQKSGFGGVYKTRCPKELAELLMAIDVEEVRQNRKRLQQWSLQNIAPQAVADSFIGAIV